MQQNSQILLIPKFKDAGGDEAVWEKKFKSIKLEQNALDRSSSKDNTNVDYLILIMKLPINYNNNINNNNNRPPNKMDLKQFGHC